MSGSSGWMEGGSPDVSLGPSTTRVDEAGSGLSQMDKDVAVQELNLPSPVWIQQIRSCLCPLTPLSTFPIRTLSRLSLNISLVSGHTSSRPSSLIRSPTRDNDMASNELKLNRIGNKIECRLAFEGGRKLRSQAPLQNDYRDAL